MKKNKFIVFEGIDGSGKSTQVKLLSKKLQQEGYKVYSTFEPTDNKIGKLIREIFTGQIEADHRTIAALFAADRLDHLLNKQNGILKKLEEGYTVICDRYYFSSYAYHGTHMDIDWVIKSNELSAQLLKADLTIFINIEPEISMQRVLQNREQIELYETLENLSKVRDKYFEAFEKLKSVEEIFITEGDKNADFIAETIWNKVKEIL